MARRMTTPFGVSAKAVYEDILEAIKSQRAAKASLLDTLKESMKVGKASFKAERAGLTGLGIKSALTPITTPTPPPTPPPSPEMAAPPYVPPPEKAYVETEEPTVKRYGFGFGRPSG